MIFRAFPLLSAALVAAAVPLVAQGGPGNGAGGNGRLATYIASLPLETLDPVERYALRWMRQEEKFARDVYLTLYQRWQLPAFQNIASSEQSHMNLVLLGLQRYGIADPLPNEQVGVFPDPTFTALYQTAVTFGAISPLHAKVVGALIEDLDILDLDQALLVTDNRDLDTIWQNLQRGSRNHMRSFHDLLLLDGFIYQAVFMTPAQLTAIVTTDRETAPVDENGVPLP